MKERYCKRDIGREILEERYGLIEKSERDIEQSAYET